MGMFDDLEISSRSSIVPDDYCLATYQTKDLDCDLSLYRVDSANQFLKVVNHGDKPEELFYSENLNQDIGCHDIDRKILLKVRNGIVIEVVLDYYDANYWDGIDPVWVPFLEEQLDKYLTEDR